MGKDAGKLQRIKIGYYKLKLSAKDYSGQQHNHSFHLSALASHYITCGLQLFMKSFKFLSILGLVAISIPAFSQKKTDEVGADKAVDVPVPYDHISTHQYKGFVVKSFYLPMRDGVKLAVDMYLPKGLKDGDKIPTLLHQTRYWRDVDVRWPFSWFVKTPIGLLGKMISEMTKNGYAVVNIDVRGSGASFGQNLYPWAEAEVKDGYEMCDWIVKQPWSNGKIGTAGASYTGTASEFLLTTQHPAIKADVNMYSLFDVYADNAFPGGIHNEWFTRNWGKANRMLDDNTIPTKKKSVKMAIRGVKPVDGKGHRKLLKEAIAQHKDNLNVNDGAMKMAFRNEAPIPGIKADLFSPHSFIDKEIKGGVPVYSYSGWSDGCYQNAATKRFLTLDAQKYKLILGPWEHGGSYITSPNAQGNSGFDHFGEILKFMDFYVKGIQNGIDKEPRVLYFTQIENKWKSAETWPPIGFRSYTFCFVSKNKLVQEEAAVSEPATITYKVDTSATTGKITRWESVAGQLHPPNVYPDRNEQDKKLITFDADEFTADFEYTGHTKVDLMVKSSEGDCSFFVYLEDIDETGKVTYVTEGQLRSLNRKVGANPAYKQVGDWHSFNEVDASPLNTNKYEKISIDLYPTSYLFKKGHKLRIAIGGHDKEHFRLMNPNPATWEFMLKDCKATVPGKFRN